MCPSSFCPSSLSINMGSKPPRELSSIISKAFNPYNICIQKTVINQTLDIDRQLKYIIIRRTKYLLLFVSHTCSQQN